MATQTRPEPHAKNFGENIESDLALEFLRVVENAAIESARTMGQGDRPLSDQAATEAMRKTMDTVPCTAPSSSRGRARRRAMLYIGEQVGALIRTDATFPTSTSPSIRSKAPTLRHGARARSRCWRVGKGRVAACSDCYMEKLSSGIVQNAVELDAPVSVNLKNIAAHASRRRRSGRGRARPPATRKTDLRHPQGRSPHQADRRRRSFGRIAAAVEGTGVHAVMGSGGAPEGVITAAAIRCLNGYMQGRS